jgi:hypothetical protein
LSKVSKKKPLPFVRERVLSLAEKHGWKASPGNKLMIVGRGDLRFEYPESWVHEFTEQSVKVRDKVFPKDVMVMEVSVMQTPPITSWEKVPPLKEILADNLTKQGRVVDNDDIRTTETPTLEVAWAEYPSMEEDPQTRQPRPAVWRQAHVHAGKAHQGKYMPFGVVSFGFWSEFAERADVVWQHFLDTLVMGQQAAEAGPESTEE